MTDASYRIEHELRTDPDLKGTAGQGFRIYSDAPLAVAYELIPDDCLVRIVRVRRV